MKKVIAILLVLLMVFGLAACGGGGNTNGNNANAVVGKDLPEINLLVMPSHSAYATLIQQQWDALGKAAGINIKVNIDINQNEFYNRIQDDKDATMCWIVNNSNPNPYEQLKFYDSRFTPAQLRGGPRWTYSDKDKVYGLFDKITSEPVMEKSTPTYKELVGIMNEEVPSIPIYVPDRLAYSVKELTGIGLTEVGDINFAKSSFSTTPEGKKVLRVATKGDPTSLMHALVTVASFNTPAQQIMMDRLFDYDGETGTYVPMLATKAEQIDEAGLRYRFTLRDDVKSWNGDKFTASDVLYSIKAVVDAGQQARYFGNFDLANCVVESDTSFVLALVKPDPFILTTLSNIPYGMMVEASVNAGGGLENMTGNGGKMPNCYTGPYKPVKWEEGSQVVFEKNADYWGGEPYFDEIVLISIKDATARVEALEGGSVDLALEPAEDMVPAIKGNSKLTILSKPTTNHHTLFLNTTKAPFDDVHVRRALAMALDYESNIAMALNGYGKHSDSILPLGNPMYFKPDKSYYTYDLNAAVEELKLSGYFQ